MKAYDVQKKEELEVTYDDLMKYIDSNRQVDLVFSEPRKDEDGYLTWDRENWLLVKKENIRETISSTEKRCMISPIITNMI